MELKTKEQLASDRETAKLQDPTCRDFIVTLDTDDETKTATFFLRKPDKTTRSMVDKLVNKGLSENAVKACLKALYLGGDDIACLDKYDDAMISAEAGVVELLKVQAAIIKKN
jgi:hypothetical protein